MSPFRRGRHVQGRARPGMAIQGGARQEGRVLPDPMLPVGPSRIGRARQGRKGRRKQGRQGRQGPDSVFLYLVVFADPNTTDVAKA